MLAEWKQIVAKKVSNDRKRRWKSYDNFSSTQMMKCIFLYQCKVNSEIKVLKGQKGPQTYSLSFTLDKSYWE